MTALPPEAVEKAREIGCSTPYRNKYQNELKDAAERGMAWMMELVCPNCGASDHPASFYATNELMCPLMKTEDGWYKVQFAITRAEWLRRKVGCVV